MTIDTQTHCEYDSQLREYRDRALTPERQRDVREHIQICERCKSSLALMKAVDRELASWRDAAEPSHALRERILADVGSEKEPVRIWRQTRKRRLVVAIGVASALLVAFVITGRQQEQRQSEPKSLLINQMIKAASPRTMPPTYHRANPQAEATAPISGNGYSGTVTDGPATTSDGSSSTPSDQPSAIAPDDSTNTSPAQVASTPPSTDIPSIPRQIIYTTQIDLTVDRIDLFERKLMTAVDLRRGYIAQSNVDANNADAPTGTWTVHIPVDQFNAFLADVAKIGKVNTVHRDSEDVTDQYYDLQARIANEQVEEARLKDYLTKRTFQLSDILTIEQELTRVQGEIEEMQGRLRLLAHQSDMSTATITMSEPPKPAAPAPTPSLGAQIGTSFTDSLRAVGEDCKALLLWLASALPYLVIVALFFWLGRSIWRRRIALAAADED